MESCIHEPVFRGGSLQKNRKEKEQIKEETRAEVERRA